MKTIVIKLKNLTNFIRETRVVNRLFEVSFVGFLMFFSVFGNAVYAETTPTPFENADANTQNPTNPNLQKDEGIPLEEYEKKQEEENASKMMFLNAIQNSFFSKNRDPQSNNLNIHYVPGNTPKVRLRYAMTTMFIFDKDEIAYISLGDPSSFEIDLPKKEGYDLNNILIIKPLLIGVDTNLSVIGKSGKIYTFYLFSTHFTNSRNPALSVFVSSERKIGKIDVDTQAKKAKLQKIQELQEKNQKLKNENSFNINLLPKQSLISQIQKEQNSQDNLEDKEGFKKVDYSSKEIDDGKFIRIGDAVNHIFIDKSQISKHYYQKPKSKRTWWSLWLYKKTTTDAKDMEALDIFDDGKYTYFKYNREKALSKFPYPYKVVDGYDNPINSRVVGNYIIAEDVGRKWTLRIGDEYVCVEKIPSTQPLKNKE